MQFLDKCIQDSIPLWERCLETPFLQGLAAGTLDEACFKGYIVDDSLYLREYAKVFAWAMIHAKSSAELRTVYSMLSFVNDTEGTTRHYYLQHFGLTDDGIQTLPLRPENRSYVEGMMDACRNAEGIAECMMAALPCLLSYQWIFTEMMRRRPGCLEGKYSVFVADYKTPRYAAICRDWTAFAQSLCAEAAPGQQEKYLRLFRSFSEHEYEFWIMSARPREDL